MHNSASETLLRDDPIKELHIETETMSANHLLSENHLFECTDEITFPLSLDTFLLTTS